MTLRRTKPFTGKHAALILVCFFGVVFAVNFTMASYASSTFGGLMVENSYVASQEFNGWLDKAEAQRSLGWKAVSTKRDDGRLVVNLLGVPGGAKVTGIARHPLGRLPDQMLTFRAPDNGQYLSDSKLPAERWIVRLQVEAGGKIWRSEEHIQ
ncbi:MAG: FixH family protein [Pontixanthobacter sp.]